MAGYRLVAENPKAEFGELRTVLLRPFEGLSTSVRPVQRECQQQTKGARQRRPNADWGAFPNATDCFQSASQTAEELHSKTRILVNFSRLASRQCVNHFQAAWGMMLKSSVRAVLQIRVAIPASSKVPFSQEKCQMRAAISGYGSCGTAATPLRFRGSGTSTCVAFLESIKAFLLTEGAICRAPPRWRSNTVWNSN